MSASSRPSSSNAFGRPRSQSRPRSRNDMSGGRDAEPQQQAQRVIDQGGDELDFCNAFWCSKEDILMARDNGTAHTGQTGYDALMNRMKNSGRMLDDFRAFYRERCAGRPLRMMRVVDVDVLSASSSGPLSRKTTRKEWLSWLGCR